MKTIQEQIAVMQHYANGGKVETKHYDSKDWIGVDIPAWNWKDQDYRIKEQKKTVTIKKWLLERDGDITAVEGNEDGLSSWSGWNKIKLLETYEVEL